MTTTHRKLAFLIVAAGLLVTAGLTLPLGAYALELIEFIRGAGWLGVGVFVAAYIVATVLLLPGSVLTLAAGFVYGVGYGVAVVWVASVLGATAAFVTGRFFARGWVESKFDRGTRFRAVDRAVGKSGFRVVFLLRLSPVFPFVLLNYMLGVTGVRLRDYVAASATGMLPGTLLYVYFGSTVQTAAKLTAGSGAASAGPWAQVFFWGGLVATAAVTVFVTRIARRALADELGDAP